MSEPLCATCGHPRDNHPYRHPFAGPSKDDTIKELEAKLAKAVRGLNAIYVWGENTYARDMARTTLAEIEGEKT
jgi:hypothetical protein